MPARLGLRRTARTHYRPNSSLTSGPPCSALGLKACPAALKPRPGAAHSTPEVRKLPVTSLLVPAPFPRKNDRARQIGLRFVRGCHEGCSRFQTQELLSAVPPRCRIPLAREPSAHGSPPPHRMSGCRRRNPARPSAARCTEDNSVLWPRDLSRLSRSLLAVGCPDPAPPPIRAVLAPVAPASFTPAPHSAGLISYARLGRAFRSAPW